MTATASALTVPTASPSGTPQSRFARILRSRRSLPIGFGVLGFLVAVTGSWIPSFWGDEAASVLSAERSLPSLFRLLGHVDAVHGVYYLFLHFWIGAFGSSEFAVRFPSAIAAGFLVAGTFLIGDVLASRSLAVVAALICTVLPRVDYMGAEARSYAFSTAIGVWLTLLLLVLLRRRSRGRLAWLGYAVGMAAGSYVFLYLGLLFLVHGAYVFSSRDFAPVRRRWSQALAVAAVLAVPIAWYGYLERKQIGFLGSRGYTSFYDVVVTQWLGNPVLAVAGWALALLAIVTAVIAWRRWRERSEVTVLAALWVLLPTAALLAMNFVVPTYNMRYLSFGAPGFALLAAAGIYRLRGQRVRVIATAALVLMAIPSDIALRGPYAYDAGSDLSQAAAVIGARAHRGDAVVYDASTRPSQRPRLASRLFPQDFAGLRNVELKTSLFRRDHLWDTTFPLDRVYQRLLGVDTVWVLELSGSPDNVQGTDIHDLESLGYRVASRTRVNRTIIYSLKEGS